MIEIGFWTVVSGCSTVFFGSTVASCSLTKASGDNDREFTPWCVFSDVLAQLGECATLNAFIVFSEFTGYSGLAIAEYCNSVMEKCR